MIAHPLLREEEVSGYADYDALPTSIRGTLSAKEWLWLSEAEKAALVRYECEPEWNE